ncbi:hypothetical protein AM1_0242 [Acaryochloris marina MBIC11017]|uniref:Uncharacterized protein n=1 Tax=Acaryochloris marina (strain MBIC 11017) TaxID=329726 RepID=B0C8T8_ACAM1|nr:hypothetical protein AM1_0242 [Acaryochloris marina MBIC11017]
MGPGGSFRATWPKKTLVFAFGFGSASPLGGRGYTPKGY